MLTIIHDEEKNLQSYNKNKISAILNFPAFLPLEKIITYHSTVALPILFLK
jgi:hypothetical protein